ncbi:MAG: hypothetical protein OXH76_00690 [Boseongicola sp.]|nr:hypothetical protein [Boseongicola sp.]MDE0694335.1 hypothetical protein [Boseongicola sp.]
MARTVKLTTEEIAELDLQDPHSKRDGGFQSLMVDLQNRLDRDAHELSLSDGDLERIPRYAFDYKNGGWQNRLVQIFGRELGPQLGRK